MLASENACTNWEYMRLLVRRPEVLIKNTRVRVPDGKPAVGRLAIFPGRVG